MPMRCFTVCVDLKYEKHWKHLGKTIEIIEKFIFGMENIPKEIPKDVFCKGYIDDNHTSIFDEFRDYGYKVSLNNVSCNLIEGPLK